MSASPLRFSCRPHLLSRAAGHRLFIFFGGLALLWLPFAFFLPGANTRQQFSTSSNSLVKSVDIKWKLLGTPEALAIMVAQYTNCYGMYGLISWLPTWLSERGGASSASALGKFAAAPYFMQALCGVVSGMIADAAMSKGASRRNVRVALQLVGMLVPAVCLLAAVSSGATPGQALALITVGTSANAFTLGGVSANPMDVAPANAGQLFAAGNTAATLAGLIAVPLTGSILDDSQGSEAGWILAFGLCSVHYVIGAFLFASFAGGARLPEDTQRNRTVVAENSEYQEVLPDLEQH